MAAGLQQYERKNKNEIKESEEKWNSKWKNNFKGVWISGEFSIDFGSIFVNFTDFIDSVFI